MYTLYSLLVTFRMITIYVYSCLLSAESSTPKTTPKSFAVTKSSTVSSSSSDSITDLSASYTTLYTTPTAESSTPKTTPKSFAVTKSSTVSSSSSDSITDLSPTAGNSLYWLLVLPFIIFGVLVLMLTRKMMKKQPMVVTPPEDAGESAGPDGVYRSLHPVTMDEDQVYSTVSPTRGVCDSTAKSQI
ncbi:uncharacterized protein LOC127378074 isoform X7 [Dicentrarchus labrax]|uniref:uncharacterized protein LOC127378074 isoform X7 n=1 Tax=Dicentrarchus labrax TaxID=13489 RepID=UPI0021F602AB|nr:uncharacterized protein LOC127378074 isoform X7 [Dicentrarchus labrax]